MRPVRLAALALAAAASSEAQEYRPVELAYAAERLPAGGTAHEGEGVRVRGVVSVDTRAFYGELLKFYVQDGDTGLCVFSRSLRVELHPGDLVEAQGRLQSFAGIVQLSAEGTAVLGRALPPSPRVVAAEELLSPRLSGLLVETEAEVVGSYRVTGDALDATLAAGRGLLTVHLTRQQRQAFPADAWRRGTLLRIRGIASQYDRTPPHDDGWQLLPRDAADLRVLRAPPLFTAREVTLGAAGVAALVAVVSGWNLLLRRQVRRRTLELQRVAEGLAEANRSLQEAVRLRDEVVSIVSHDFRSPLTVIQGYSERFASRAGDEDTRQAFDAIRRQARHLDALAADTLTMSRIEAGALALDLAPVDLVALVRGRVDARALEAGRAIEVEAPERLVVRGDEHRLGEVVDNLLDNAVKYSPDGARVKVTLERVPEGVCVVVADQGLGIPAAEMDKLFRKFSRLDAARARRLPGSGLGLYIARSLVEAHGGRIWAQSDGAGTRFAFAIPEEGPAGSAPV